MICVGGMLKELATTLTPVPLGTSTEIVTAFEGRGLMSKMVSPLVLVTYNFPPAAVRLPLRSDGTRMAPNVGLLGSLILTISNTGVPSIGDASVVPVTANCLLPRYCTLHNVPLVKLSGATRVET